MFYGTDDTPKPFAFLPMREGLGEGREDRHLPFLITPTVKTRIQDAYTEEPVFKPAFLRELSEAWDKEREEENTLSGIFEKLRLYRSDLKNLLAPETIAHTGPIAPRYKDALCIASHLADEYSPLAYHNHHHAREVTLLTQKLLAIHQSGENPLPPQYVYLTLIAACIHDYKHDGTGNRAEGAYIPVLLEHHAVESAWPHLEKAGLGVDDKTMLHAIVDATDVFAPPHQESPRAHLRDTFNPAASFPAPHARFATSRTLWEQDPHLRTCAAILSDADLGLSCGLPQPFVDFLTNRIEAESKGTFKATPDTERFFYTKICEGFPLTQAGEALLGSEYKKKVRRFHERTPA